MDLHDLQREILKDPVLLRLSTLAKKEKIPFFLVGGYLRDLWLGTKRKDYDFTLPGEAFSFIQVIEGAFGFHFFRAGKAIETSTFRMMKGDISMDITFFQGRDIPEDLLRRDFTINTLAFSLADETWHWAEGALEDIRDRRIRTVSGLSLDQDPLRMLRAIRYACSLHGFLMVDALKGEISSKKDLILRIPGERVRMELDRILLSQRPLTGINLLYETGLLFALLPELKGLENLGQSEHHHLPVLSHTLLAAEKISWAMEWARTKKGDFSLSQDDFLCLYYAILFHDIGKDDAYSKDETGKVHFYHHESFSCQAAEGIMERLRFSNLLREKVLHLIRNHMRILNLPPEAKETTLKRLVHQIGEAIPLLAIHSLADKEASRGSVSLQSDDVVEAHCLHLLELFRQEEIVHPPALISGNDVMALGYQAGPGVGKILNIIRRKQVDGEIKTREEALRILRDKFSLE